MIKIRKYGERRKMRLIRKKMKKYGRLRGGKDEEREREKVQIR